MGPIARQLQQVDTAMAGSGTSSNVLTNELSANPWSIARHFAVLTNADNLDLVVNKLSSLGQLDDIKAWATDDGPNFQMYILITFRYVPDLQRVLSPVFGAQSRIVLVTSVGSSLIPAVPQPALGVQSSHVGETSVCTTTSMQEIALIQHHLCPYTPVKPETEGITRSVIFYDSRGHPIRLTPKFQHAIEVAWQRVRENLLHEVQGDMVGDSPVGHAVPEPWRGQWWILYPEFDLVRGRTTFESVEVARRVVKKMCREKWGGEWDVNEGRYVRDPVFMEELEDDDGELGEGNLVLKQEGNLRLVRC
ncbi:hypothetical protein BDZ91DRAFT_838656 [Kalaharituber pfeilii]|nr:hypothetical protein BDZ91DRAFT_838656 [Kalaharituber pfeilii]